MENREIQVFAESVKTLFVVRKHRFMPSMQLMRVEPKMLGCRISRIVVPAVCKQDSSKISKQK